MTNEPDLLSRMLAERDCLLADGATGTNLFDLGLASGEAPEIWLIEQPDRIGRSTAPSSRPAPTSS